MAQILPERGETLVFDTLVYLGTVITAFGIGSRMDTWMANQAYAAPLLYIGILIVVYAKWVLPLHQSGR